MENFEEKRQIMGRFNFVVSDWEGEQFRNIIKTQGRALNDAFLEYVRMTIKNHNERDDNIDNNDVETKLEEIRKLRMSLEMQEMQLSQKKKLIDIQTERKIEAQNKAEAERKAKEESCFKCGNLIINQRSWSTPKGNLCRGCYMSMKPEELRDILKNK